MALVAVGNGVVGTSRDGGATWSESSPTADMYNAVIWTGTLLVAVGVSACMTSPDGVNWTPRAIPPGTYDALAWSGSLLVAVGASVVATSPDGITWTSRTIPAGTYYGAAWNGSVFAAVGQGVAATSPDGTTWTSRTVPINPNSGVTDRWNAVCWASTLSLFVAAGVPRSGTGEEIMTSPDGITWTWRDLTALAGLGFSAIAWNGTTLVAVGENAAHSTDGVTWSAATLSVSDGSAGLLGVAWDSSASKFCAIGSYTPAEPEQSPDGSTWTYLGAVNSGYNAITASPVPSFSLSSALAMDAHRVRAFFSSAPLAASPAASGDALDPATWTITAPDGTTLDVLSTALAGATYVDVYLAENLLTGITYTLACPTLLSASGTLITSPATATFVGVASAGIGGGGGFGVVGYGLPAADVEGMLSGSRVFDTANRPVPDYYGGTLVVGAGGDYVQETGSTWLKKMVLRRLATSPGDFFHLPSYGVGLKEKKLVRPSQLPMLKREIEQQLSQEPELSDVKASLSWAPANGILQVLISATIRASGAPFQVTTSMPLEV